MYREGVGVEKDSGKALNWYRRAAEAGNSEAAWDLGKKYERGDGAEKDPAQAV